MLCALQRPYVDMVVLAGNSLHMRPSQVEVCRFDALQKSGWLP